MDYFSEKLRETECDQQSLHESVVGKKIVSSALCHLAGIAYRVDHTVHFDNDTETFRDDAKANALLTRPEREPYSKQV